MLGEPPELSTRNRSHCRHRSGPSATEPASSTAAVSTKPPSLRHSPRSRNHTGPRQGAILVNAATTHGLPRVNPSTVHSASSQNTLPDTIAGEQNSSIATTIGVESGLTSQKIVTAEA